MDAKIFKKCGGGGWGVGDRKCEEKSEQSHKKEKEVDRFSTNMIIRE